MIVWKNLKRQGGGKCNHQFFSISKLYHFYKSFVSESNKFWYILNVLITVKLKTSNNNC